MNSFKFLMVLISIAIAYYVNRLYYNDLPSDEKVKRDIVEAWQALIRVPTPQFSRICVGTNANVDLIVKGTDLLTALELPPMDGEYKDLLFSLEDLQSAFHFFFRKGAGGERSFMNHDIFKHIINTASLLKHSEWYIGGNAALMAQNLASRFPEIAIQLVGPVGPRLTKLLHKNIEVMESSQVSSDEVHLIMEYAVGEKWGASTASVATRFITSHDIANGEMKFLDTFFESYEDPDLLILSGLHLLESQSEEFFQNKIVDIIKQLKKVPSGLPIHLELASMGKADFVKALILQTLPVVDSLGLNEQELSFISSVLGGPHSHLFAKETQPEIYEVTDILTWLITTYGQGFRLTRIHFHSLKFHIIATLPKSRWFNSDIAVAAGTQVAGLQACDTSFFHLNAVDLLIPQEVQLYSGAPPLTFSPKEPVISFEHMEVNFVFSPVLVCRQPLKTVGLGDAISATGLIHSGFKIDT